MSKSKYSKEQLEVIIKDSFSYQTVLTKLGLKPAGGNHSYIRGLIEKFSIDVSHFRKTNSGRNFTGGRNKLTANQILTNNRLGRRETASKLRKALIESGVEEKCEQCNCPPEWNGKPLVLQVDHRDGDGLNNLKENLRFLCPSCHSQTENFGTKNRDKKI